MRALSSRPFCPCDSRQAGLWYLPARWRYTTTHRRCMVSAPTPGEPGRLSHTAAAATSQSAVRTGRHTARGRAHGAREHPGCLRDPGSSGGECGPLAWQLDRQHALCRAGQPDPASESSALHTAHARVFQGPDVVRETTLVFIGLLPSRGTAPELASTVANPGADPWSGVPAHRATRDPSDGSGSDRSYLDDG